MTLSGKDLVNRLRSASGQSRSEGTSKSTKAKTADSSAKPSKATNKKEKKTKKKGNQIRIREVPMLMLEIRGYAPSAMVNSLAMTVK